MNRPEQSLHKSVCEHLKLVLPKSVFWTSLDHAGGGPVVGRFRKIRGVKKGLPDIMLINDGHVYFIELKSETGRLTPEQRDCHFALAEAGAGVATCRTIDAVAEAFVLWHIPTRDQSVRMA